MLLYIVVGLILLFLVAPILIIIPLSLSSSQFFIFPPKEFSLRWFENFFSQSQWIDSLLKSFQVAFMTSILATVIGTMAALAITRLEFRGKQLFMGIMVLPIVVPLIVVAIAVYRFYSHFNIVGSTAGLVMAHSLLALPIVFVTVLASLKGFDRNIELAAMNLGSTPMGAFFKVTLPIIKPAVISSALFAFITSLDEIVVTIFIGGSESPTLPKVMWEQMRSQIDPTIAAASTLLIISTVVLFGVQGLFKLRQKNV
ncbi:MAG TPA: ABC transporter permease [Bacillus sp. (in: firmicutes)]|nr:ABC transporter permease [Bacillus sp. (in: firmicutes)]